MWASTRGLANLVGRCLILRPAPSPPLSFSFCLFERLSERSSSLPSPAGIENASPSRPLAAPLTTPFLVDLHASSPEARTWKIGRGRQYEATNEGNAASSAPVSLGGGQLRLENRQHDLRLRRQFSVQTKWRWRAPRIFPIGRWRDSVERVRRMARGLG